MKRRVSYAQNREDILLSGFFEESETGFYVDVGANEATHDSVTKYFYDRGWHGINIEPLQQHFDELQRERPRDINLQLGISDKEGELTLREYINGTGLSTMSDDMQQQYDHAAGVTEEYVDHTIPVETLAAVFKLQNVSKISFMKVDVEGFEYEVLAGNDWKKYRPEVICIEANHVKNDWRPLLHRNDYQLCFFDGLNEYYVAKEQTKRLKDFSYVNTMIMRGAIVDYVVAAELEAGIQMASKAQDLEREINIKSQYIVNLEGTINQITPLRRHFKRQLKQKLLGYDTRIRHKLNGQAQYQAAAPQAAAATLEEVQQLDRQNFVRYRQSQEKTVVLRMYTAFRRAAFAGASHLLRIRKV